MRNPTVLAGALLFALATAHAAEPPELARIERQIKRQPAYAAEKPLFGLYVFGPTAESRVWAVLDKSAAEKDQYDVLYFDRDGDGDLTEEDERIIGEIGEPGHAIPAIRAYQRKLPCA